MLQKRTITAGAPLQKGAAAAADNERRTGQHPNPAFALLTRLPRQTLTFGLLALIVAMLAGASPVYARAIVARASPSDGAVLGEAPRQVRLWMTQTILVESTAVELVNTDGAAVPVIGVRGEPYKPAQEKLGDQFDPTYLYLCSLGLTSYPTALIVDLPDLPPGTYRLTWRTTSAGDARASSGTLVFSIQPGLGRDVQVLPDTPASVTRIVDDLLITLSARPNLPGQNFITLNIASTRRPAPAPIEQVTVRLLPPAGPRGAVTLVAQPQGEGRYQLAGRLFQASGAWQIDVTVQRQGLPDVNAAIPWSVPAAPNEALSPGRLALYATLLFCLVTVIGGLVVVRHRDRWGRRKRS